MRCSISRRISSLLATSGISKVRPLLIISRMSRAFACESACEVRACASCVLRSLSCCALMPTLLVPRRRPALRRYSSTLASAKPVDIGAEPARGVAGHVLLRGLLHGKVELGNRVRAFRGKLRILRAELDRDDARLADRID